MFTDASNDKQINAGEQCFVKFYIKNRGKGLAKNCEARVQLTGNTTGITVENVEIPIVAVGKDYEVSIPIIADTDIQDGTIKLIVEVYEPNGWGIAPFDITITTKGYESPFLQVVDYKVASESGEIKKMQPFVLTFNLQNTQYGIAEDVKVNISYPDNVYILDGQEDGAYDELKAGEAIPISLTFVVNNKYPNHEVPISVNVHEKYGKFAENKQLNIALNEAVSSSITIIAQDNREEIVIAHMSSDVDRDIPQTNKQNKNTFVVIIANENYDKVDPVQFALNDGNAFQKYCEQTLGIPSKNIHKRTNATGGQIQNEIDWLQQVCKAYDKPNILFYYAGHGVPNKETAEAYILPKDGNVNNMNTCYKLDDLYASLGSLEVGKVIVFLDACFSGASLHRISQASGGRSVALKVTPGKPKGNMIVFSATQEKEIAYPYKEKQHGMFTYYLLKKIQATSGDVTLKELGDYIQKEVMKQSVVENEQIQTPKVDNSLSVEDIWQNWTLK